jgi:FAD:protein FMN transferase
MTEGKPSRRRVLTLFALGAGLAGLGGAQPTPEHEWRGEAMGARVRLLFAGRGSAPPEQAVAEIMAEIERLERIFSLSRSDSEISLLNAEGVVSAPSLDFLSVLDLCRRAYRASGGLFDPTVQPLWNFYLDWYRSDPDRAPPDGPDFEAARRRVGFDKLTFGAEGIALDEGARLTLNGVAQGYVTDRGVEILKRLGFDRVLVDLGEMRALGTPEKGYWTIDLPDKKKAIRLHGGALATSAGSGMIFAHNGDHHLFDPRTGRPARYWKWLTAHAPSAVVADALSTALYVAPAEAIGGILSAFPRAAAWAADINGKVHAFV